MTRLKEIEKRMAAISVELENDGADLEALDTEITELKEERQAINAKIEKRKTLISTVASMELTPTKTFDLEERKKMDKELNEGSVEYRNAFLKKLLNEELTELEKRAFIHTTENTGEVIPTELQNKIYSTMEEAHPLLKDVQVLRTGTVISIVKHTAIVAGDAAQVAEGVANADEENTFVNVTLSGKDFSKHVDFSYRLGKMSIPAFEQYLVKEISDRIGAAMTRDIVAQIKVDLATTNKINAVTPGTLSIKDFFSGLGLLKKAGRVNVYANNATFYGSIANMTDADTKLSFIPNYQEAISGQILGKGIKEEDALAEGEVLILDPSQFVYNVVQDIMLERDKNIKTHVHTIAGFAIAEGTLTNDKAGALITVGVATP
ncbi:phage major capsid protein [Psychrobacillus psychrodurans]|uniref:phage major capsid protein n=1 Tax=Psychrobacillus psychrodurans TaxID=126157 RepID=UPI0008F36E8C|nr:phage major capsid protein [Psychrobacillus psychrodurans]MCZ8541969.1 phage major capsid protein [Psychrobacillus psychrodurans]SFN13939.1 phage major capsid protein, HK97 family [Psychrobacillus psychrodurans]